MSQEMQPNAPKTTQTQLANHSKLVKTLRRTLHWGRRWAKTAKPTEWVSSVASVLAVASALAAGFFLYNNGFFDQKKSELEARKSELEIKITKAEIDRDRLATTKGYLETSISDARIALKDKEDDLRRVKAELAIAKHALDTMSQITQEQAKWDSIRSELLQYSSSDSKLTIHLFRHDDQEHPRHIWGIDINEYPHYGGKPQTNDIENILSLASKLPSLQFLSISNIDVSRSLKAISNLNLSALYLRNCGLTDGNIGKLNPAGALSILCLSGNKISKLPPLRVPSSLKALKLCETNASDESIAAIVSDAAGLQVLHCSGTELSDNTFRMALEKCPQLGELDCSSTKVTSGCVMDLINSKRDISLCCGKEQIDPDNLEKDRSLMGNTTSIAIMMNNEVKSTKYSNKDFRYNVFTKNDGSPQSTDSHWPQWVEVDWTKANHQLKWPKPDLSVFESDPKPSNIQQ